jgi:hypothetical protein
MVCVFLPSPLPLRNSDWCFRRASYAAQEAFLRVKVYQRTEGIASVVI